MTACKDGLLSIVVPVFNEEENLEETHRRVSSVAVSSVNTSYEIVYVDDGSRDASWRIIARLAADDPHVRGIRFARNFGHQYALKAGMDEARGDAIVTIDADLQQPPELIEMLWKKWKEGYIIVDTRRRSTHDISFFKRMTSTLFYRLLNVISDVKLEEGKADFRLLDRRVVDYLRDTDDPQIFLRGIVAWFGFESATVEYEADARAGGESGYSLRKMVSLATSGIMSFSLLPLRVSIFLGFLISFAGFLYAVYVILTKSLLDRQVEGWSTLVVLLLIIGGVILSVLGVTGEYIGRIYQALKSRPLYVVWERKGGGEEEEGT